jgi:Trypsin-like peptidase domain/Tetratricopeptide Repeats-Sensor
MDLATFSSERDVVHTLQAVIRDLEGALDTFHWGCAESLSRRLAGEIRAARTLQTDDVLTIVKRLRKKRQFRSVALIADALFESHVISEEAARQYAQALTDSGYLTAAEHLLNWLVDQPNLGVDQAEIHGMRGRIDKQRHINTSRAHAPTADGYLVSAVRHYLAGFDLDRTANYWHGINAVALLKRAADYHIVVPDAPDATAIAREIAETLAPARQPGALSVWQLATLLEACVALGEETRAIELIADYASAPGADAFEIGGTLRQFEEVWELVDNAPPGDRLLPMLRAALLKCQGGTVTISPESATANLQKAFSAGGFRPVAWFQEGLKCCSSIVRVETALAQARGTGWLFHHNDLFPNGSPDLFMMTNAHVLGGASAAVRPENAVVRFQMSNATSTIAKIEWSSTPDACDAVVARLDSIPPDARGLRLSSEPLTMESTDDKPRRLYVIGHPGGGDLQFSLHDSVMLDCSARRVHYRTPTEGGSSGSPVFDEDNWHVVALHHAGQKEMVRLDTKGCTYEANEGVPIAAIRDAIRAAST